MLSNETLQLIAMGGTTIGVIGAIIGAFPYLKKKGVDVGKDLDTADKALQAIEPAIDIAKGVAPLNPIVNAADLIEKWAKTGVKNAEQLYASSQLTNADDRNTAAKNTIYAALKEFNITPNDNQEKLINDTIEAAVNDLPHAPADIKQLQTTIDQQTSQNLQLQNENTQLKQTIQAITTTAQAVQTTTATNTETPAA